MRLSISWLTTCFLAMLAGLAWSSTELTGTVSALRGNTVQVDYQPHPSAPPQAGDKVEFSTSVHGIKVWAGAGEVIEVDGKALLVRLTDGKAALNITATIQATGKPQSSQPSTATVSSQSTPGANAGMAWSGRTVSPPVDATGRPGQGRIGVGIMAVTAEWAATQGLSSPQGALTYEVETGGPAEKAGMKVGDIVLRFDGRPVEGVEDLAKNVSGTRPGSTVTVRIWRNGTPRDMQVVVAAAQAESAVGQRGGALEVPAGSLINQLIAADAACDMQGAQRLAEQARQQQPDNAWLRQNLASIQAKAQRDATYRKSIEAARGAIAAGDSEGSYRELQVAMRHASVQCGQDGVVRDLHAQTGQVAEMQREAAIRKAKEASAAYDQWRRERETRETAERARRESDARQAGEGLIEALGVLQKSMEKKNAPPPANTNQNSDWMGPLIKQQEQNETWQRYKKNQGW